MAAFIILGLGFLALMVLPSLWVRSVIARHGRDRPDFPGTGGEFARHVLDEMKLRHVTVEPTDMGDNYDPSTKTVRLIPEHFDGRSLSAVVIAAHEVGHAMQDATDYKPLKARVQVVTIANWLSRGAALVLMITPVLLVIAKSPAIIGLQIGAIVILAAISILMHATTLPVEFDASFRRAMPLLKTGGFIPERDYEAANSILRAAALTYVAAAAIELLNVMRWLRFLRF
ncbi:MAG: zinc metallopeptidase [Pseudomonadota bacterium]